MSSSTYRRALERVMQDAMEKHQHTMIIGQGVADHKGVFGTTLGLVDKYPSRVIEAPLSEDAIAGICIGASLNGLYPINTHIRADFGSDI
jgi:pyruvate/2-oxoglutarate/acetoin dehydrogenase E1 component